MGAKINQSCKTFINDDDNYEAIVGKVSNH